MEIGTLAQWAGATATLIAVVVALFKEDFTRRWRSPKLSVVIRLRAPDCIKTPFFVVYKAADQATVQQETECYYFRLWIENNGNQRAERVQVYAVRLLKKHADGVFRGVESFLPMNLRWAHALDPSKPEIFGDINPKMGKHCDLGRIVNPKAPIDRLPGVPEDKTILHLDTEVEPATGSHLLPPDSYQLHLRIAAANVAPVEKRLELSIQGNWYSDQAKMFADGIGIRELG
jgi:hypothetical protein